MLYCGWILFDRLLHALGEVPRTREIHSMGADPKSDRVFHILYGGFALFRLVFLGQLLLFPLTGDVRSDCGPRHIYRKHLHYWPVFLVPCLRRCPSQVWSSEVVDYLFWCFFDCPGSRSHDQVPST